MRLITCSGPAVLTLQALRAALDNISVVACHSIHALLTSLDEIAHQASLTVSSLQGLPTRGNS